MRFNAQPKMASDKPMQEPGWRMALSAKEIDQRLREEAARQLLESKGICPTHGIRGKCGKCKQESAEAEDRAIRNALRVLGMVEQ